MKYCVEKNNNGFFILSMCKVRLEFLRPRYINTGGNHTPKIKLFRLQIYSVYKNEKIESAN
jgi:hypothetical protein